MRTIVANLNIGSGAVAQLYSAVLSNVGAKMQRISEKLRKFLAGIDLTTGTPSYHQERFFKEGCYGRLNF